MEKELDFTKEELDFTERDIRQTFIQNTESGLYAGTDVEGKRVVVLVDKGTGMDVKHLNRKGWYEGYSYDKDGFRESEILEKA